ncbi:arsenite resistance protein [Grosmannia clavigera kw1407]|uniref:Arsenite resistance protein n=1 Tax=Grosmannia clavigera (strain kw1407 / UAMH 11150) TaxID=655863 RepID=F0XKL2_GROCL|nr:arsenite resistance protein [Grosmannia clavigera kw1407]EFX01799.1 arsenite resistance protein [Grosmannia clavigera kw1407]
MDSYVRDSARSPPDRSWASRDESRGKDDRDTFYRGRSPALERNRRTARSRSPAAVDRYEPRSRGRDEYGGGRDRDRDDRRRIGSPPANIDRYVPGQSQHQSLQPPQDGGMGVRPLIHQQLPPAAFANPIPDPLKLPYQVGFSFFGEWWRANEKIKEEKEWQRTGRRREPERNRGAKETQEEREKEKARIQAAYDSYKEELQGKMAQTFVKQHKEEQWFRERYVPEIREKLRQQLAEFRKGQFSQWEQDLESGLFDEFTLEGIPKNESNGAGMTEKEEGEANEVLGVGDLVPAATAADIRDESLFQPTLLIKTIAPSVSRQNLETFCREHLGVNEGGFRFLSLSDPNPSKRYHRIGWILLNPGPDDGFTTAGGLPDPDSLDGDVEISTPKTISVADRALEAINGKTVKDEVRGDFVCHVGVHNPQTNPRRKALWDLFSAPERIDKDLGLVQRLVNRFEAEVGSDFQGVLKIEERVEELRLAGRLQSSAGTGAQSGNGVAAAPKKKKKAKKVSVLGMDVAVDDFEDLGDEVDMDDDEEEEEEGEEGAVDEEVDDEELLLKKKQLDLLIEYLRRVFSFCFFCVFESDSAHELTRKCPAGHLRRPRATLTAAAKEVARASASGEPFPSKRRVEAAADAEEGELPQEGSGGGGDRKFRGASAKSELQLQRAYNWVRTFEEKINQILEPESVDLRKYGGKPVDEAMDVEMAKYVKQEDEHKWRCRLPECTKLFKEEHFWRKHVEKRHTEWWEALKDDIELVNAYVSDPSHIAPSRTDANSNGHFPAANGQTPTGTPRGFSLQSYAMNSVLPSIPGFSAPGPFNMFNPVAMQVSNWQAAAGGAGMSAAGGPLGDSRGQGPIRRGGPGNGRYNNRSGPYDRRPMRWSQDGGLNGAGAAMYASGSSGGGGGYSRGGSRNGGGVGEFSGSGGPGGGGRWGDGAGGGAAVGPREAIQGRTIKSYEDLDQVTGGGGGELNY